MLGLRRWHKVLLVAELCAFLLVVLAYQNVLHAREHPSFLAGMFGCFILSPSASVINLFVRPPSPDEIAATWPYFPHDRALCLTAAGMYTLVFFCVFSLVIRVVEGLRAFRQRAMQDARLSQEELHRYLR